MSEVKEQPAEVDLEQLEQLVAEADTGGRHAPGVPRQVLRRPGVLDRLAPLAGWATEAGPLQLTGRAPNGQAFSVLPWRVWTVSASAAVVRGQLLGLGLACLFAIVSLLLVGPQANIYFDF